MEGTEKYIRELCKAKSPDYLEGFLEGVWAFAHWKDGIQYVGTTGTMFSEVQQVLFKIKNGID